MKKLTLAEIFPCEPVGGVISCPRCHGFKVVTCLACPKRNSSAFRAIPAPFRLKNLYIISELLDDTHPAYNNCLCCYYTSKQLTTKYICTECDSAFLLTEGEFHPRIQHILNTEKSNALIKQNKEKAISS